MHKRIIIIIIIIILKKKGDGARILAYLNTFVSTCRPSLPGDALAATAATVIGIFVLLSGTSSHRIAMCTYD